MVDEVGRREDEALAHDVRVLLVAAHDCGHAVDQARFTGACFFPPGQGGLPATPIYDL